MFKQNKNAETDKVSETDRSEKGNGVMLDSEREYSEVPRELLDGLQILELGVWKLLVSGDRR